LGVAVGVGVFVASGGAVLVGVAVGPSGQVVSLKRKLNVSSGTLPAWPATWIVTFGSKFVTTILNTSEAPFLKLLNLGWNSMLAKPGMPVALVQTTLYVPRLPVYVLPLVGAMLVKLSVPMAT
jgi:hypothetical protein